MNGINIALIRSAAIVSIVGLTGCGGDQAGGDLPGEPAKQPDKPAAPIMLKVHPYRINISQEDFNLMLVEPVKRKYPNITLELVGNGKNITEIVTAGDTPDLLVTWQGTLPSLKPINLQYDMNPQVQKEKVDLNRFDTATIDAIKVMSDKGELLALPYEVNFGALYYNKDIFDRFGVPYPTDGMTWEDAIGTARKVTRTDGGIAYRGLDHDTLQILALPLSATFLHGNTDMANITNASWIRVLTTAKQIYDIQGNMPAKLDGGKDNFVKDRNLAMLSTVNILSRLNEKSVGESLKWDIAQYPSYKDKPNTFGMVDLRVVAITPTSKFKTEAMHVVQTLVSDEVQLNNAKATGRATPLKNMSINKSIGAEMPYLKGKQIDRIFKSHPAPAPIVSAYESLAKKLVNTAFEQYLNGKDINTVLREAEEEINKQVAHEKGK
jgi:multiple sugar transport system substrate-binding protein